MNRAPGLEVSSAEIQRCPVKSLAPSHYRADGTCKCGPHPLVGKRVRLGHCTDPHTRLAPGAEGTVSLVDSLGTVHVKWDDGHSLGLIYGVDSWQVIEDA